VAVGSTLWSRTRKAITSVPHISHALRELGLTAKELTDGELYNHDFKDNFEKITTIVGQKKDVEPDHELVQYHIYDFPCDKPYKERLEILKNKFGKVAKLKKSPLKLVETIICNNEEELMAAYDKFTAEGYEGAMARNLNATYEYKRSSHLQKIKEFEDAEFEIIGVEEGRGKLQGHAGAFVCVTEDGTQFKAKMSGDIKHLKNYWEKQDLFIGQMLTVKFQGLTGKNSVPRFPVGLRIRNYE
jgi:ATP-dependent DNA ligase